MQFVHPESTTNTRKVTTINHNNVVNYDIQQPFSSFSQAKLPPIPLSSNQLKLINLDEKATFMAADDKELILLFLQFET